MAIRVEEHIGAGEQAEDIEAAYGRHRGAVVAAARRVLGDAARAEDVAQEVFVGLWTQAGAFDPARGSLRTFLMTVAKRRAIDALRADTARQRREARAATDPSQWLEVPDMETAAAVRRSLAALPAAERAAIVMAFFGGRTYREAAAELGLPEGTVKTRIRSGLVRLRAELAR